jgi:hypothetical protein
MSRLVRGHVEARLRERFPGADVTVDHERGDLRIEVTWKGAGTLIAITGDEPSGILAALLTAPGTE